MMLSNKYIASLAAIQLAIHDDKARANNNNATNHEIIVKTTPNSLPLSL